MSVKINFVNNKILEQDTLQGLVRKTNENFDNVQYDLNSIKRSVDLLEDNTYIQHLQNGVIFNVKSATFDGPVINNFGSSDVIKTDKHGLFIKSKNTTADGIHDGLIFTLSSVIGEFVEEDESEYAPSQTIDLIDNDLQKGQVIILRIGDNGASMNATVKLGLVGYEDDQEIQLNKDNPCVMLMKSDKNRFILMANASITSAVGGYIKDVKVNGESVVNNGVANIEISEPNDGKLTIKTKQGDTVTDVIDFSANQSDNEDITFAAGKHVTITTEGSTVTISAESSADFTAGSGISEEKLQDKIISTKYTNSNELDDDLESVTVGGLHTTVSGLKSYDSIDSILDAILFPTIAPTATAPTVKLTIPSSSQVLMVGTTLPETSTFTVSTTLGTISMAHEKPSGTIMKKNVDNANSVINNGISTTYPNDKISTNPVTYTLSCTFKESHYKPCDNKGNENGYQNIENYVSTDITKTTTATINPYYPLYYTKNGTPEGSALSEYGKVANLGINANVINQELEFRKHVLSTDPNTIKSALKIKSMQVYDPNARAYTNTDMTLFWTEPTVEQITLPTGVSKTYYVYAQTGQNHAAGEKWKITGYFQS